MEKKTSSWLSQPFWDLTYCLPKLPKNQGIYTQEEEALSTKSAELHTGNFSAIANTTRKSPFQNFHLFSYISMIEPNLFIQLDIWQTALVWNGPDVPYVMVRTHFRDSFKQENATVGSVRHPLSAVIWTHFNNPGGRITDITSKLAFPPLLVFFILFFYPTRPQQMHPWDPSHGLGYRCCIDLHLNFCR